MNKKELPVIVTEGDLEERIKELNCLYAVSALLTEPDHSLETVFEKTVHLIPSAWQYPDIAGARITFRGREYKTDNFLESPWRQTAHIPVSSGEGGTLEVCYREERPIHDEGPFLTEERQLIESLGSLLGSIADRHEVERRRLEIEARFRAIFESAPIGMALVDPQGCFVEVNDAYARMLGYDRKEFKAVRFLDITHPADVKRSRELYEEFLRGERDTYFFEKRYLHRDGRTVWVSLTVSLVKELSEKGRYNFAMAEDITERRRMEHEILEIRGREQRRIGQELHDGLGSHLTGLALMCRGLIRRLEKGKEIQKENLEDIAVMVQEGSTQARMLAHGLNPVKSVDRGLSAALEELSLRIQKLSGVSCVFEGDVDLPQLDSETTLHLYRIVQEAANNSVKHAHATTIRIKLTRPADTLCLVIIDDGEGLPENIDTNEGIGIRIMLYRARLIGATFSLENAPGGGTIATCAVPLDEYL